MDPERKCAPTHPTAPPPRGWQPLMRSPLGSGGLGALLGPTVQAPGSESGPGFVPQLGVEEVAVGAGGSRSPSLISQPAAFPPQSPGAEAASPAPDDGHGPPHLPRRSLAPF